MSALALPLPFRAPLPPLLDGLSGTVGYWARLEQLWAYLRTLQTLPHNVTTPPNNWPGGFGGVAGTTLFWLLLLEFLFPAPVADGTLPPIPEGALPDAPIGTNPPPELDTLDPLPGPIGGTFTYRNAEEFTVLFYVTVESLENPPRFDPYVAETFTKTYDLHERAYSVDYKLTEETSVLIQGPDELVDEYDTEVFRIREYNTETQAQINDNTQAPVVYRSGTTPDPFADGRMVRNIFF